MNENEFPVDETELLDFLLEGTAEDLDIPDELHEVAVREYEKIATWLAAMCTSPGAIRIYPQGSFRLGTVVRPTARGDQYDIDLVFLREVEKESTTQAELKRIVGDLLMEYVESRGGSTDCPKLLERGRCWTLDYSSLRFHLDILPTIPDYQVQPHGVLLTDRDLFHWQHSNPIGYATWFRQRETETQYRKAITAAASARGWQIDDVPEYLVRTPLQRVVQILKRQRDLHFADDLDNRPPSILLTTLAAHAYQGEESLLAALNEVLHRIPELIENRDGVWWIENPAHAGENFADKWNQAPERRVAFLNWTSALSDSLNQPQSGRGLAAVTASLGQLFGEGPVKVAAARLGDRTRKLVQGGGLATAGATLVRTSASAKPIPRHTFHGPQ
jgi:hypothetical protein